MLGVEGWTGLPTQQLLLFGVTDVFIHFILNALELLDEGWSLFTHYIYFKHYHKLL